MPESSPSGHHRGTAPEPILAPTAGPARRAVLFDFHGTVATTVDNVAWITHAARRCGVDLDRGRATVLADRLATAGGLPGAARPARVPPHLAEDWADRDLSSDAHRRAYTGLAETVQSGIDGLADAVYDHLLTVDCWAVYPDAAPTMAALRAGGVRTAIVSNIGFDIRPFLDAWQLSEHLDAVVLSYEVGCIKPDSKIFYRACAALRVDPEQTLMVGDTAADAGAVDAGCAALVAPSAAPGRPNGLHHALDLALPGSRPA